MSLYINQIFIIMNHLNNRDVIKQLYKKPIKEKIYPTNGITAPKIIHQIDVLYFTNDNGYKYLLTIVDVYTGLCDARPIQRLYISEIIEQLTDIYRHSEYLKYPRVIQCDSQFNCSLFREWCNNRDITLRITEPDQHRQNANVESLNGLIGHRLWLRQLDREISTGTRDTAWLDDYQSVVSGINNQRRLRLNRNLKLKKPKKVSDEIVFNDKTKYVIKRGTLVRLLLPHPESLQGERLTGAFRKTDPKWRYSPIYVVKDVYLRPGNPPQYVIESETGKPFNHMCTNEMLQIIS